MDNHPVILFDGICNLCNRAVQFVIKHDPKGIFKFASLQSEYAKDTLKGKIAQNQQTESIILIENGQIYRKSTAALLITRHLSGGWKICRIFLIIPAFLRDAIYLFIAKNRYKWFGKRTECMVPSPDLKDRFMGE